MTAPAVIHYLVGSMSACRKGEMGTTDRAAVTCRRCLAYMDAGEVPPQAVYSAPFEYPRRRPKPAPEPKETMDAAGLRIVLDAPAVPLKRTEYPE